MAVQVMASAAQGLAAATALNVDLVLEDARAAGEQAQSEVEKAS